MRYVIVVAILTAAVNVAAQSRRFEFDIASVKVDPTPLTRVAPGEFIGSKASPGGRFVANHVTLRNLVVTAYDEKNGRRVLSAYIDNGPTWIDSVRFDIDAKFDPQLADVKEGTLSAPHLMLRRLLEDRFHLRVHFETRHTAQFALVMANRNRQLGPQLRTASGRCVLPARSPGAQRVGDLPTVEKAKPPNCPFTGGNGMFAGSSVGIDFLAGMLGGRLRTKVINRTGLDGLFDIELAWRPDDAPVALTSGTALEGESLSSALVHQLGLKLEPTTGPVDVLVIDHVERPSDN